MNSNKVPKSYKNRNISDNEPGIVGRNDQVMLFHNETVYKVKTSKWLNKFSHKLPEALFINFIPQDSTPKIKLRHDLNKDEDPEKSFRRELHY